MSSSTQSPLKPAEAEILEPQSMLDASRLKFQEDLEETFEQTQKLIYYNFDNAFARYASGVQAEQKRGKELVDELDNLKAERKSIAVKLAEETLNHGLANKALYETRSELGEVKSRVAVLERDLETVKQQNDVFGLKGEQLSTKLDAVNKHKADVEAELERSKLESANLQERLSAAEQQNVDLQATLKATEERASTAEKKLNAFKSMFMQINDGTATSASSCEQQPSLAQPLSSTHATIEQGVVEQSDTGQQSQDTTRPQSIDSQVGNGMSDRDSDLSHWKSVLDEVMDPSNEEFNHYFLSAKSLIKLADNNHARVGPMTLGTMKERLANGNYNSATSFKADFYSMIAEIEKWNTAANPVRIAAERLAKIFDKAFSSQSIPGHKFEETAPAAQDTNEKKRKAESDTSDDPQDEPAQKRRSPASLDHRVDRKLIASKRLGIEATLSSVAQLVSFEQSPSTITGDWKSLLPKDFRLTKYTEPSDVQRRISALVKSTKEDMIVLRLTPASETDRHNFNRILEHLFLKKKFATISHVGINNVESIDLITASKANGFPGIFPTLDFELFPCTPTEDMLFIAIVFPVAKDKRREVRRAWNERMAAVQNHDQDGLPAMRRILARSPLHIFRSTRIVLTSAERHLAKAKLNELPLSDDLGPPELQAYGRSVLRVSYNISLPKVDGVSAPEWVFVLGRLMEVGAPHGLLVVDVQNKNRPVWLLRYYQEKSPSRRSITLLAAKFPGSLSKWEENIPESIPTKASNKHLENTGVMLERCSFI